MLMQNFQTPVALGISDAEFEALVKVLGMLERGEIEERMFDMWTAGNPECGTPGCILGWAWSLTHYRTAFDPDGRPSELKALFYPGCAGHSDAYKATPAQAAIALRSYLNTGEPRWAEAMEKER